MGVKLTYIMVQDRQIVKKQGFFHKINIASKAIHTLTLIQVHHDSGLTNSEKKLQIYHIKGYTLISIYVYVHASSLSRGVHSLVFAHG